jgi:arsenate reductase-like glutaredoxin family protein
VTADELIKLMLTEPRLIRRPLLLKGDVLVVGAEPKSLEQLFGGGNRA